MKLCEKQTHLLYIFFIFIFLTALCIVRFILIGDTMWFALGLSIAVSGLLLVIAAVYFATQEIPDFFHWMMIPLAVAAVWVFPEVVLLSRVVGVFVISAPMLALAMVIKGAFGGGDMKLMAVCGFLLGWQATLVAFFIAVLLGGGWGVLLLATGRGKKGQQIAFGPALCTGVFVALLWGADIVAWYRHLLFL